VIVSKPATLGAGVALLNEEAEKHADVLTNLESKRAYFD